MLKKLLPWHVKPGMKIIMGRRDSHDYINRYRELEVVKVTKTHQTYSVGAVWVFETKQGETIRAYGKTGSLQPQRVTIKDER